MRLYFLRHGSAEPRESWKGDDADRPLTKPGRKVMVEVGERLAAIGLDCDLILTSPFVRAAETAKIVAAAMGAPDRVHEDSRLESGFGVVELRSLLAEHSDAQSLMLVGHEPDFSELIGELVGRAQLVMKKGALARVDLDTPEKLSGVLVWLAQPKLLRP